MPQRIPLSKERIAALPLPATGRLVVWDTKVAGLAVRLTATGATSFYLVKRQAGRVLWVRLGAFPGMSVELARRQAQGEAMPQILSGENPNTAKRELRDAPSLADVWGLFTERHADKLRPSTLRRYQDSWRLHINPQFGDRLLVDVSHLDVERWQATVAKKSGRFAANRALALLRTLFRRATVWGFHGESPCTGVAMYAETPRERVLSADEVRRLLVAVTDETPLLRDALRLLFLTGARKGNVSQARWDQISLETATWTIPAASAKGNRAIGIPLVPAAIALLTERRAQNPDGCPWVFPSPRKAEAPIRELFPAWERVCRRAELYHLAEMLANKQNTDVGEAIEATRATVSKIRADGLGRHLREQVDALVSALDTYRQRVTKAGLDPGPARIHARLHDVRRTVGSFLAMNGVPLLTIAKLLGHANTATTQRAYAFLGVDSLREPLAHATSGMIPHEPDKS